MMNQSDAESRSKRWDLYESVGLKTIQTQCEEKLQKLLKGAVTEMLIDGDGEFHWKGEGRVILTQEDGQRHPLTLIVDAKAKTVKNTDLQLVKGGAI